MAASRSGDRGATFVGFGLGAIQTGLFLWEAQQSGNFDRLVVALPNPEVVAALRRSGGRFFINIATPHGREVQEIHGVEALDPKIPAERATLIEAIAEASELATALPSVATYTEPAVDIAGLIAAGLVAKLALPRPVPAILYAGENHNHAAAMLRQAIASHQRPEQQSAVAAVFEPLDTVIGKMSRLVRDPAEIAATGLQPYVEGGSRAYLVESFNRILVTQPTLAEFHRRIPVFAEKRDLLPFEEAKLYGHNAAHVLLGYLARRRGLRFIADAAADGELLAYVRAAFLEESGAALIAKHAGLDPLFTPAGYQDFADDLLTRMINPWLRDDVERVTRDPRRKLGWDDRLIGTMRLALGAGIRPERFAAGAALALEECSATQEGLTGAELLDVIWLGAKPPGADAAAIKALVAEARPPAVPVLPRS